MSGLPKRYHLRVLRGIEKNNSKSYLNYNINTGKIDLYTDGDESNQQWYIDNHDNGLCVIWKDGAGISDRDYLGASDNTKDGTSLKLYSNVEPADEPLILWEILFYGPNMNSYIIRLNPSIDKDNRFLSVKEDGSLADLYYTVETGRQVWFIFDVWLGV